MGRRRWLAALGGMLLLAALFWVWRERRWGGGPLDGPALAPPTPAQTPLSTSDTEEPLRPRLALDAGIPGGPVRRTRMALPARYRAQLPGSLAAFSDARALKAPPPSYVRARLAAGDAAMQARVLQSLRASAEGALLPALVDIYARVLAPEDERTCDWMAEVVQTLGEEPQVAALLWDALVECDTPAAARVFETVPAPAFALLERQALDSGCAGAEDRVFEATRQVLEADDQELFPTATLVLSQCRGGEAASLLSLLEERATPQTLEAVRDAAKQTPVLPGEPRAGPCPPLPTSPSAAPARDQEACLERWAATDWPATAAFARALPAEPAPPDSHHRDGLATLRQFGSAADRDGWLRTLALLPEGAPSLRPDGTVPLSTGERLALARRAMLFDPETGAYPNGHDTTLSVLATLAGPALADVVFEEVPPPEEDASSGYVLHAYASGHRYSVDAASLADWQDVTAMLVLLNGLLEDQGLEGRYASIEVPAQHVGVVFGRPQALQALAARGLWRLVDATDSVRAALELEAQLLERHLHPLEE